MDIKNRNSVGIAGVGMVGSSLNKYFNEDQKIETILYDKPKNIGNEKEINEAYLIFICVNTPRGEYGEADISQIKAVLDILEGEHTVVIKSTVPPGTTRGLAEKYQNLRFIFNPEFLTEATAYEDLKNPARQVIGFLEDTEAIAKDLMGILPKGKAEILCLAEEAEMIKYVSNAFYATKVIFCNEIFDICEKAELDYKTIKEGMRTDPMIGPEHLEIWHKGYRGFGTPDVSKCLPKDLDALIAFARKAGKLPELLRVVNKINFELFALEKPEEEEICE